MKTKRLLYKFLTLILIIFLEMGILTCSASIPSRKIRDNILQSAEYLMLQPTFFNLSNRDAASRIDRYADSILLNIAYCYDSSQPFSSIIKSAYYQNPFQNENTNLLYCVENEAAPTCHYMRYWHGSLSLVRPLFLFITLPGIYMLGAILLLFLLLLAAHCIRKETGKGACFGFILSALMTSLWYLPFSLEYMPSFMIAFGLIPAAFYIQKKHPRLLGYLFLLAGSLTSFTDFLTTETITLLLPLTLLLLKQKQKPLVLCIQSVTNWLLGYICTWASKWILYSLLLKKNALTEITSQTLYRTSGEAVSGGILTQISGAVLRNLHCLFPFSLTEKDVGYILPGILLLILGMIFWIIKKQKDMPSCILFLLLIGCIPYLRFSLLSNHSYIHCFFTFRAQFVSVFCLFLIFLYGTDTDFLKKEWKKHTKKSRPTR